MPLYVFLQVLELRSKEKFTKGDAVDHLFRYLLQHLNMDSSEVLAIHVGDDKTDEDAFKVRVVRKSS
jgi:trehalose-6-phosphatase